MPEKDKTADYPVGPDGKKLKPCCACPETKRVRDECIMEKVIFLSSYLSYVFDFHCRERKIVDT